MAKTASLTSGLVAKKGQAMPAVVHQAAPEAKQAPRATTTDRDRYEALKTLGVKVDKKSQEIFVEALDLYLAKTGEPA